MSKDRIEVVSANPRIIENKLLDSLEAGGCVAILLSEQRLQSLIDALNCPYCRVCNPAQDELLNDLLELKRVGFP